MEKVSVNKKVGRPRSPLLDSLSNLYVDVRSRRGLQNKVYQIEGMKALNGMDDAELKAWYNDGHKLRVTLLVAVGKLAGAELQRAALEKVYRERMTVDDALSMLRAATKKPRTRASLVAGLQREIAKYRYELSPEDVLAALAQVYADNSLSEIT